jgi:hypothetical protein
MKKVPPSPSPLWPPSSSNSGFFLLSVAFIPSSVVLSCLLSNL